MKANNKILMTKDTRAQVGIGTLIIFIAMVLVAAVAAAVLIQTSGVLQQKAQATGKQATQEVSSNLIIKSIEGVRANNDSASPAQMSTTIDLLKLRVGLNVGSAPVDVNQVVVSITDGSTANDLVYANNKKSYASAGASNGSMASTADPTSINTTASVNLQVLLTGATTIGTASAINNSDSYYVAEKIRDEDASFSQTNPVMNTGDLVTVYLATTSTTAANLSPNYKDIGSTVVSTGLMTSGLDLVPRTTVSIILTPESGAATTADFVTPSSYGVKETVSLYP